nr:hypothetical protein [Lettuce chlorosis virus]
MSTIVQSNWCTVAALISHRHLWPEVRCESTDVG